MSQGRGLVLGAGLVAGLIGLAVMGSGSGPPVFTLTPAPGPPPGGGGPMPRPGPAGGTAPPPPPVGALPSPGSWAAIGQPNAATLMQTLPPKAEERWSEDQKVAAASSDLRLPELLQRLRGKGHQARVIFTWRTLTSQDALMAEDPPKTKVSFSFHNAVDQNGNPAAMAADIVDARYGWGDNVHGSPKTEGARAFFVALGAEAHAMGLQWGGDWRRSAGFWDRYGIGWDPAHVQSAPNERLGMVRAASLERILGRPVLKRGSGGYVYAQFANGYIQVHDSSPNMRGQLILPNGSREAWQAITTEIGPPPRLFS